MKEWILGSWELADETSSILYEIYEHRERIKVKAVDRDDGEELKVKNVRWKGVFLEFETFVPSNEFRAKHRLFPISKGKIKQELTSIEYWRRRPTAPLQ